MAKYRIVKTTYCQASVYEAQKLVLGLFWISIWADGEVFPKAPVRGTLEEAERCILRNRQLNSVKVEIINIEEDEKVHD